MNKALKELNTKAYAMTLKKKSLKPMAG